MLLLCNKARESLADTNARFVQFREVLLAMEGTAGANGLAAENSLLRVIRARGNRILQKAGHNHMLAMAVLRNRLLLPDAEIALVIIKGDEYALLSGTTGSPGGTAAPPTMDGGRPASIAIVFMVIRSINIHVTSLPKSLPAYFIVITHTSIEQT